MVLYCEQDLDERELRELAALTLDDDEGELDYRDDGYIELVLKILGLMCDGQNRTLQVIIACAFAVTHPRENQLRAFSGRPFLRAETTNKSHVGVVSSFPP